jgi:hypothetical protein
MSMSAFSGSVLGGGRGVARAMGQELGRLDANATIANAKVNAVGNVGAAAVGMLGNLTSLCEQVVKQSPAAAPYVDMTMRTVAITMGGIINDMQRW